MRNFKVSEKGERFLNRAESGTTITRAVIIKKEKPLQVGEYIVIRPGDSSAHIEKVSKKA
jgi:hypothetical protein